MTWNSFHPPEKTKIYGGGSNRSLGKTPWTVNKEAKNIDLLASAVLHIVPGCVGEPRVKKVIVTKNFTLTMGDGGVLTQPEYYGVSNALGPFILRLVPYQATVPIM